MPAVGRMPLRGHERTGLRAETDGGTPPAEMSSLADWARAIDGTFQRAAAGTGVVEQRFRLADASLAVQSAGPTMLERLGSAFAHLSEVFVGEPDLRISVWDSESTGVEPPPLPATDESQPRGAVVYSATDSLQIAYQPGLSQLSAFDSERRTAWFWCRDAAELPFWEPAAPFRQILHWWLARRELLLLHGAAVGTAEGGVLLVGRGGSGKSTCALASLTSDLLYAGDDYVAARVGTEPWVYSLYCSGKLVPGHATLLPHLPPPSFDGDGTEDEKAVFYVSERFPDRMCCGFPLRAVFVPRVTGSEPRILPVEPGAALRALAPSTLLQLHPARPEALRSMAGLLRRVPTYSLEVGPEIDAIPKAIERFLHDLPR